MAMLDALKAIAPLNPGGVVRPTAVTDAVCDIELGRYGAEAVSRRNLKQHLV